MVMLERLHGVVGGTEARLGEWLSTPQHAFFTRVNLK